MHKLTREDLYSLEQYAEMRPQFRAKLMAHKRHRRLAIGPNAALYFEDRLTIQYQIQEMLRVEKIFEKAGIKEELDTYNPLIPDGCNLKATFMLEYHDEVERRKQLGLLIGIEEKIWMSVDGHNPLSPFADEDLERTSSKATSAVHFLRFEFDHEMIDALKAGAKLATGIDHPSYSHRIDSIAENIRNSLIRDFD